MRAMIVLLFAVVFGGGSLGHARPAPLPTLPVHPAGTSVPTPGCLKAGPTTVDGFNTLLGRVNGWQAGDGGYTAMLDHGRRAWSFGDSLLGDNLIHHNALVIQDKGCVRSMKYNEAFLTSTQCGDNPTTTAEEAYCWGGPIAYANGFIYMVAPQMRPKPDCSGAWCFASQGSILFTFTVPPNGTPTLASSTLLPATNGIFWNSALMVHGDDLYVYGYRDDGDNWTFGYDTYVAKVPLAHASENTAWWTYYGSGQWQMTDVKATPVLAAQSGPETGVSVAPQGDHYALTSTMEGGLGHVVTEWTSATPWGPWAVSRSLADYPDTSEHMWYLPLQVAGTDLYVISQNWPNRPLSDLPTHPSEYRVRVFAAS